MSLWKGKTCPHCGKEIVTTHGLGGSKPNVAAKKKAYWAAMREKVQSLKDLGVPLLDSDLLGLRGQVYEGLKNMLWVFNSQQRERGEPEFSMLEFDPWFQHADRIDAEFVREHFGFFGARREAAKRLFGVVEDGN